MRTSTLALLGLVAIAQAMPARGKDVEKREELPRDVDYSAAAPLQVRVPQRGRGGGGGNDGSRRGGGGGGGSGGKKGGNNGGHKGWGGNNGGNNGPGGGSWGGNNGGNNGGGSWGGNNGGGHNGGGHDNGGGHNNGGGGGGGSGGCQGNCGGGPPGVPDKPYNPHPPSHPEEPEEPEYPENPDDGYPDMPDMPDMPDFPDDDMPGQEVTIEDIIKAQQELIIMQNLIDDIDDPMQRMALERGIEQIKAFLKEHAGIVDIEAPPGVGTILRPGLTLAKRGGSHDHNDLFKILDEWTSITTVRYSRSHPPPFAIYMIACQLAEVLSSEGFNIDTSILDAWSTFKVSDKAKRQDGIFALPGSCGLDDVIGLETILATIQLIYGSNPPAHIQSLRNAVMAALLFCGAATPDTGTMNPDRPNPGGPIIPDRPTPGAPLVPEDPEEGAPITPDRPAPGSPMVPDGSEAGSPMVPETPEEGGELVPDDPEEGAPLKPSDRRARMVKRQHPNIEVDALADALAVLEKGYGGFGSGTIPMPIFMIMQSAVALLESYGMDVEGWPDLVGESVKLLPPAAPGA